MRKRTAKLRRFLARWLVFKPLYKFQKIFYPESVFPKSKPICPRLSKLTYNLGKWSIFLK